MIFKYVEQNKWAFTWKDVQEYLIKSEGVWVDIDIVRRVLKEKLNYTYRRCSLRPLTTNWRILKLRKILFLVKLCKLIKRGSILVNIDEAVYSPPTKINYSWNRIGMTSNRSTTLFSESVSIVSSILSNGISITGVRIGTIKSNTFIEYIGHLIYVCKRLGLNTNQICLFIDNSPVHWTKNVKEFLRENESTCIFLPQYAPDMAPVELFFGQLKRMIWGKRSNSIVNLKKNSGKKILAEVVKSIYRVSVMRIWQHFVSVLKQLVGEIDSDLNIHI